MRRLRALIFTAACVVGTVPFSSGATVTDRSEFCPATAINRVGCEEHLGTVVTRTPTDESVGSAPRAIAAGGTGPAGGAVVAASGSEPEAGPRAVPPAEVSPAAAESTPRHQGRTITATAVMHVPTPEQPASEGQMGPLTDKAMVLLIGWVMLVLLGGGICAGGSRHPRRRRVQNW